MNSTAYLKNDIKFVKATTYSMIMACDSNGGIGYKNSLPWGRCDVDMKWFRASTLGKIVIMGRTTFESLDSKPLPGRINIVLSTTLDSQIGKDWNKENENDVKKGYLIILKDVEAVRKFIENSLGILHNGGEVMVIGGAQIYSAFWDVCSRLYLTTFDGTFDSDVQVQIPMENFELIYLDKRSRLNPQFAIYDCVKDDSRPLIITREELQSCLKSLTI